MSLEGILETAAEHHRRGELAAARVLYLQVLAETPDQPVALHLMGVLAAQEGDAAAAVGWIRRAIAVWPDDVNFHANLAHILERAGRAQEAADSYRAAVALAPDRADLHFRYGSLLCTRDLMPEAATEFESVLRLEPRHVGALNNLAVALARIGRLDDAMARCHEALELAPNLATAHAVRGNVLKHAGQVEAAAQAYRRAMELDPDHSPYHSNLLYAMSFDPGVHEAMMREELARWNARHAAPHASEIKPHLNDPQPARRLKVGYVSPDFCLQSEAFFVVPLFEAHDRERFEIHAYASVQRPDDITARLRNAVDHWHDVRALSDDQLAAQIRADAIDILVDLTMHMANHRLGAFARKPAPIQVTWLAYPGSTGLHTMDYRLTDAWMDPPGQSDAGYSEKSIRLPHSWCCYHPLDQTPPVGALPALQRGQVTFGSLNNPCKNNPAVFALWAGILNRLPDARLLLLFPECRRRNDILDFFQRQGVAPRRIEFIPWLPRRDYLQQYDRIDIALDPFPYNGITTTCDALWMGVPVLTCPGAMAPARAGLSLLENAGLHEFVAASSREFVEMAVELANNRARLEQLRIALRGRMQASCLMDSQAFAQSVENAYREVWEQWCAAPR